MILRRLSKHLKDQNWLAVALDFVIVVAGVWLGVLLGNLNSASLEKRSERAVLMQLHAEIMAAEAEFEDGRVYNPELLPSLQAFVKGFYHDEGDLTDEMVCNSAAAGNNMPNIIGRLSAVEELISTGGLSELGDADLRQIIAAFHEMSSVNEVRLPQYEQASVHLQRAFPQYFTLTPFIEEGSGEVRMTGECDVEGMRADKELRSVMARNIDIYDAWYRRYVIETMNSLAELHANTDRVLGIEHDEAAE